MKTLTTQPVLLLRYMAKRPCVTWTGKDKVAPYTAPRIDPSILDSVRLPGSKVSLRKRAKINKDLESRQKEISERGRGILNAAGTDIADVINDCLSSSKFSRVFRRVMKDPTDYVHISRVVVNRDLSHADAYWSSPMINNFVKSCKGVLPDERCDSLQLKMAKSITDRLQKCEPQFRSQLSKKISFKKVPRIFFRERKAPSQFRKAIGMAFNEELDVDYYDDDDIQGMNE